MIHFLILHFTPMNRHYIFIHSRFSPRRKASENQHARKVTCILAFEEKKLLTIVPETSGLIYFIVVFHFVN